MSPLGLRIRELRDAKGWSQRELARRAGIRPATLSHLESDRVKGVRFDVLEKIAKALEVAPALLLTEKRKR